MEGVRWEGEGKEEEGSGGRGGEQGRKGREGEGRPPQC